METGGDRTWTAHIVIASEHAGLRPYFKRLEEEILHVLARVDDPRDVKLFIEALETYSEMWLREHEAWLRDK